jgi:membrane-associated protease RseP (regulator of RpoE activity)
MSRNSPTFLKPLLLAACLATAMPMAAIAADAPAYELGIVGRNAADGVELLAITPGSPAERIGLQAGDHLVSVNGEQLGGIRDPLQALQRSIDDQGGQASIGVLRNGVALGLSGRAAAVSTVDAASRGCGYVTTEAGVLPLSKGIFHAVITQLDGRSTPLSSVDNRYRLPAGRHVLTIGEDIRRDQFNHSQLLQLSTLKRHATAGEVYKVLVVDVKPDQGYRIGAQLLRDKLDAGSIHDNAYWEPVVWSSVAERCR